MTTASLKTEPGPGEVLLFRAEVPPLAASMITRLSAKLDRHEQDRAARFIFEQDRAVFVAAHALLRHALGSIFEEGAIRFRTNAYGKPELDLDFEHGIHFSLSHTRGMAVCAICRRHPIGVDVEAINRSVDIEMLAEQYFAAWEHALIVEAPSQHRAEIFFRLWTLKEAMLKAVGIGLAAAPLREFAFTLEPVTSKMQLARVEAALEWQVCEYSPTAVHRLALAVRRSAAQPVKVISQLIPLEKLT
ncbi:4'-phosphopantetheinyl transferase superfamily protein [Sinorhizobium meliloti]|uniref:4'-phosphopantetheinyl transferase family protein n=1 Tax=Sinorhizobium TaxID=28105 RepID=UPI0003DD2D63|nr:MULTISPECIES: 4'-phosphopantetheinyl transferase superfamily protein [Sinorhizobium]ARS66237.1 hypothetical protein SMRU11_02240 [Sinorhizobium meliloti RU11/001]MDE3765494.1 4'-phosphopantetheinyl transferase superfamily protein [Sinorhizobium meliloti]MDE3779274.1 4'-phosphopantetheinyl transferase superfamily protein [Sinorhizobium meliloti]MDE3804887.1 4'-phosphopantetheinyl transferase superfamily protein [Sinorhizobium meliloti]MDE3806340.1 4'-phosphopantetheinyl transferase superfami